MRLLTALSIALVLAPRVVLAQAGALEMGLEAHADYTPVYRAESFVASNRALNAVFRLGAGEKYKVLDGAWIALDAGSASPPNHVIAKGSVRNATKGTFKLSLPRGLPPGKYRFDVEGDGKPWKSVAFTVIPDMAAPPGGPDTLLLKAGQSRTYDFMQQPGSGAKMSMPGVTPDAQGRYRASVTVTAAGTDEAGTHVEMRRNDVLVFQEWFQVDKKGLASTKRKSEEETIVLDPPQLLFAWPPKTGKSWNYTPRDKSYRQKYTMWGPLPIKMDGGDKPGYVVFVEQRSKPVNITVERHFVPGIGLVRENIVTAVNDQMVSRQEMVLKP